MHWERGSWWEESVGGVEGLFGFFSNEDGVGVQGMCVSVGAWF